MRNSSRRPSRNSWQWGHAILIAAVTVVACDLYDPTAYSRLSDSLIDLRADSTVLRADGFSRLGIHVQLTEASDPGTGTPVVVRSSHRALVTGDTVTDSLSLSLPRDGSRRVDVRSLLEPATLTIEASLQNFPEVRDELEITLVPASPEEIIPGIEHAPEGEADGATPILITVSVTPDLPTGLRTVQLTTTMGKFGDGGPEITLDPGAATTVSTELMSPQDVGEARLQIRVAEFARESSIQFDTAFPEQVTVTPDALSVGASLASELEIRLRAERSRGSVTTGVPISMSASDTLGNTFGIFRDIQDIGSEGQAVAFFSPGTTAYRGRVAVVGAVSNGMGGSLADTTVIFVVDPD